MNYNTASTEIIIEACKKKDQKAQMELYVGKDSTVQISGSGSVSLHAENSLEAMISGSGDLFCYGKPEKQVTSVSGSGKILFKD